jgi:diguanylate cyclase (GGDEF)-like protein
MLVIVTSFIQVIVFDRFFLSATDSLLLVTNEQAADNLEEQLGTYFKKIENSLKAMASDANIRDNPDVLNKMNEIIPEIDIIMILDKKGNIVGTSGVTMNVSGINLSQRDYFQRALKGETYISDVYTTALGNEVVSISTPIIENDTIAGVIVGTIRLHGNILASMFDNKSFGRDGFIAITDQQGAIVYHPDKERIGKKAMIVDSLQEQGGSTILKNYLGIEYYIGYSKVPKLNWMVSVNTPTSEITKFRRMMVYEILAISLITIVLIIAIGSYTVRHYMKPIDRLIEAFSSVKKGEYKQISPQGYAKEFAGMIQVYNDSIKNLEEVHEILEEVADRDSLTGVYNRRSFDKALELLDDKIKLASLNNVGMLMLDIDNFKSLNDTQGHLIGDEVLKEFVAITTKIVGDQSIFRFGGDEFAITLTDVPNETSAMMAEKIRLQAEQSLRGCTVSIGIASYPEHTDSIDELLNLADKALYISKESKNKVTIFSTGQE